MSGMPQSILSANRLRSGSFCLGTDRHSPYVVETRVWMANSMVAVVLLVAPAVVVDMVHLVVRIAQCWSLILATRHTFWRVLSSESYLGGLHEVVREPLVDLAVVLPPELPIKQNLGKLTVLSVVEGKTDNSLLVSRGQPCSM